MTNRTALQAKHELISRLLEARRELDSAQSRSRHAFNAGTSLSIFRSNLKQEVLDIKYRLALEDEKKAKAAYDAAYGAVLKAFK